MKIISLAILLLLHPVHVSLTGIDYDNQTGVWSVFVKVWTDDLELDMELGLAGGESLRGTPMEQFFQYLSDRIIIMEDEKILKMELVSAEEEGLEHRFTMSATGREDIERVTVINRIMTRLYDDQANMTLFSYGEVEDGYRFTVTDTLKTYRIK